uniref:S1 motif domain-containing protein n=1 Tax=Caenorhabditis tropicalis TaxID=1561998 RepID=A0A1I7TNC6_9PELO
MEPLYIPSEKGYSYIRKQPNTPRNCLNMPIPFQYCICQFNKTSVSKSNPTALKIGQTITKTVNEQIKDGNFTDVCIKMKFKKVTELQQYNDKFKGSTLFTAKIVMEAPSSAVFEANVKMTETGEVKVLGVVERSNKYGDTADCIKSEEHRPFCFCKNQNVLKTTVKR